MKNQKNNLLFLGLTGLCGIAAAVLRVLMLSKGLDEKGLLVSGNLYNIGLWVLSIGYLAALIALLRTTGGNGSFQDNFSGCRIRGGISIAAGALLTVHSLGQITAGQMLVGVFGAVAGVCMAAAGLCRWQDKHPIPLPHILVCVFFIIRLVLSFQGWSADPQLQDYALQMLACVCLMLFSFHRASCDAGIINRRRTAFFGLAAVYFCLASLSDQTMPLFYFAAGAWTVGAGCTLEKLPEEA